MKLSELHVRESELRERRYLIYNQLQRGLALQIEPTGHKAWKCIYSISGRPRCPRKLAKAVKWDGKTATEDC